MNCFLWEHFERAVRNLSLLARIILTAVILSLVGDYDLDVSFWSESTTLKQWNFILNTSLIHVLSSLNVIKCIGNNVPTAEELVRKHFLSLLANLIQTGDDVTLKTRIQLHKSRTGSS
jgi:hypothetical protein